MKRIVLLLLIATFGVSSCGVVRNATGAIGIGQGGKKKARIEVDGVTYRARARTERGDKRLIMVTANPFASNPDAAVEAAVYEATRYCILTFGGSDIEWTIGPDTPVEQLPVDGNSVTLSGRCSQR